ncbi:MAG: 2-amino-4-hydroxy-6-hydroxymethyldihydropteridine diphosphokinase [Fidelibacterota bacterium]
MADEPNVFLSLGSNLGDRFRNLRRALTELNSHPHVTIQSISPVYRTEPMYNPRQADFFNCVVHLRTDLKPDELLRACTKIEEEMGRRRTGRKNSARPIDLDIVFFGNRTMNTRKLNIPHPGYAERKFVLVPLENIAPGFVCPDTGMTVKQTLRRCADESWIEVVREAETA